jgi:hypothetical protein
MKQISIFEKINQQFFSHPIFGTHPDLLARKTDPVTSKESAKAVDTTKLESIVYEAIKSFGSKGCISDEVLDLFPKHRYSSITARYAPLLKKGFIEDTGETKKGNSGKQQRIMRAV